MTKKVEYICNLCNEVRDTLDLRGIYFTSTGYAFEFRAPSDCNTHLCKSCANAIIHQQDKVLESN